MESAWIIFQLSTGDETGRIEMTPPAQAKLDNRLQNISSGAGIILSDLIAFPDDGTTSFPAKATIVDGEVISVSTAPDPPILYVHTTITGGMQSPAGTLYLKNDGVDALQVHAELRDGPDPATSSAVTQLDGQDITAMWALELINVDNGALADTPLVQMTAGVIDVSYTTTIAPCEVELAEDRLQSIGNYQLKLAEPVRFKVVRALS